MRLDRHGLIYNGIDLRGFGVYVSGEGSWTKPAPEFERVSVPGRSGDLITYNRRYSNVDIVYRLGIVRDFNANYGDLIDALLSDPGYHRLEDTSHPGEYRMAMIEAGIDPSMTPWNRAGEFDVIFNCKPQIYLTSGELPVSLASSGTIFNPTLFESAPLIRVYGSGTLTVNGDAIAITGNTGYTDLDCDLEDAFYGAVNRNSLVTMATGEFPRFRPGVNSIQLASLSRVEITPRWWRL